MKKILILCYTVLIAAFILPLFFRKLPEEKEAPLTLPELQQSARQDAAAREKFFCSQRAIKVCASPR